MAVTRRTVLEECLEYERDLWKLCSKDYNMLLPMKGMEDKFDEQKEKCRILMELLQAIKNESVCQALAGWQMDVMENGPTQMKLDGGEEAGTL